jgi:two-component system, NtrC family, response regulator HydG
LSKLVLIVDDDKSVLRTFSRILQKNGFVTETAETGKEAVEKANAHSFDVVLFDYRLPDMDGIDLLAKMLVKWVGAVKLMITGLPSFDLGAKAIDMGIDGYLVKPVKPDELLILIQEKLNQKNGS